MSARTWIALALAASAVACGEPPETAVAPPPDPEHGLETRDSRDDSFAVRPGTPEATAVLTYVNRDIANNLEGDAFLAELDRRLHVWSARNIVAFRAGSDLEFGTTDDQKFDDLDQLDAVPWVGRSALMHLFELADAAGLFTRPAADCVDHVPRDRNGVYRIDSYADLLAYENSECARVEGDVVLDISRTDVMPPSARSIRHLRFLEEIDGDLRIETATSWNSVHFEGLRTVTGEIRAEGLDDGEHTLEFTALTSAGRIEMFKIHSALFPALQHQDKIELDDSDLDGFTALQSANRIAIHRSRAGVSNVSFPALRTVSGGLTFEVKRQLQEPVTHFAGEFEALERVGWLKMTKGGYTELQFPRLAEVGSLVTSRAMDPHLGLTALTTINVELTSEYDRQSGHVHHGPVVLETVGEMRIRTVNRIRGYDSLQKVNGDIILEAGRGIEGFEALEEVGSIFELSVTDGWSPRPLSGFNALTHADEIRIDVHDTVIEAGALFERLERVSGSLAILSERSFSQNPVFPSLAGIAGDLHVGRLGGDLDMFPSLELVDGNVTIERTTDDFAGFASLEVIEGNLMIGPSMQQWSAMPNLTSLGGNLGVPSTLPQAELDTFLSQLEEFSGRILWN